MIDLDLRLEFPLDFLGSIYKTTLILGSGFYLLPSRRHTANFYGEFNKVKGVVFNKINIIFISFLSLTTIFILFLGNPFLNL